MAIDPIELKPTNNVSLWKTITVASMARKQVVFQLTDAEGKPIDLLQEPTNAPVAPPTSADLVNALPVRQNNVVMHLMARDGYSGCVIFDEIGTIPANACKGLVSFLIQPADTVRPGIYTAAIGRFAGGYLVDEWPVFVDIQPSIFSNRHCGPNETLTVAELRLAIRDLQVGEIALLDKLEFSDAEIMKAMRDTVDLWNETPPYLRCATFTPTNFPFRVNWQTGAIANLLAMAARSYDRNDLQYGAGGTQINDQAKGPAYQKQADAMKAEFTAWMMRKKREINMKRAWSTT